MTATILLAITAVLTLTAVGWAAHHSSQQRRMAVDQRHTGRALSRQARAISAIEKRLDQLDGGEEQ